MFYSPIERIQTRSNVCNKDVLFILLSKMYRKRIENSHKNSLLYKAMCPAFVEVLSNGVRERNATKCSLTVYKTCHNCPIVCSEGSIRKIKAVGLFDLLSLQHIDQKALINQHRRDVEDGMMRNYNHGLSCFMAHSMFNSELHYYEPCSST